jgi:hypothetical protein
LNPLPHRSKRRLTKPILAAILALAALAAPLRGRAATVWTGPPITYTQTSPYPNPPGDRDQLTPSVSLTRALTSGLFNGVSENSYSRIASPADTEWAVGSLADYAILSYAPWEVAGGGRPVISLPGQALVVHLISDDIYLSLTFTELGGHGAGGFSYQRSTPAGPHPPRATITNPFDGASFVAPATVTIQAAVSDAGNNVTNVEFFDGATSLGSVAAGPYTISVGLAVGSHTLTAVASDDLGTMTTSTPVTVSVANDVPPTVTVTNPHDGVVLSAPATVALAATAADVDGSVTNVQFFQGTASLGNMRFTPFGVTVNNLGAGDYAFSAVATDDGGLSATNAITLHVVTPVPIVLGSLQRTSPTSFQFTYSATVGLRYVVERSGNNLGIFTPMSTNTAASNPVTFLDNAAFGTLKFYRVGLLPNP